MQIVLKAPRMKCGGCVATVTEALRGLQGVEKADADAITKDVRVDYDAAQVDEAAIRAAMAAAGFPAEGP